jgi:hypothetical protein
VPPCPSQPVHFLIERKEQHGQQRKKE